jgi:hypothetical protein
VRRRVAAQGGSETCVWRGASISRPGGPHVLRGERAHETRKRFPGRLGASGATQIPGCCKHQSSSRAASGRVAAPGQQRPCGRTAAALPLFSAERHSRPLRDPGVDGSRDGLAVPGVARVLSCLAATRRSCASATKRMPGVDRRCCKRHLARIVARGRCPDLANESTPVLQRSKDAYYRRFPHGRYWARTSDLLLVRCPQQVLTRCRTLPLPPFWVDLRPRKCSHVVTVCRNHFVPAWSRMTVMLWAYDRPRL